MQNDDTKAGTELDDEQLKAVNGGTTNASKTLLVGKKGADSAPDEAATMTAIALAESGGRTG